MFVVSGFLWMFRGRFYKPGFPQTYPYPYPDGLLMCRRSLCQMMKYLGTEAFFKKIFVTSLLIP